VPLFYALSQSSLNVLVAAMAGGLVIGIIGHLVRSRLLILLAILVIGAVSVYFAVFVAKVR
jgi:hypothetical protein